MPRLPDWLQKALSPSYVSRLKRVIEREKHHLLDYEEQFENSRAAIAATRSRIKRLQKELQNHGPRNHDQSA